MIKVNVYKQLHRQVISNNNPPDTCSPCGNAKPNVRTHTLQMNINTMIKHLSIQDKSPVMPALSTMFPNMLFYYYSSMLIIQGFDSKPIKYYIVGTKLLILIK